MHQSKRFIYVNTDSSQVLEVHGIDEEEAKKVLAYELSKRSDLTLSPEEWIQWVHDAVGKDPQFIFKEIDEVGAASKPGFVKWLES